MKSSHLIGLLMSFLVTLLLSYGFIMDGTAAGEAGSKDRAIRGYDPVAYFKAGEAKKGDPSHSFSWHSLTWHFQNEEHRRLFQENSEKFAPQYDGYCAWAMTEARKAETDPEVWKIVDGKLYLNCSMAAYEKWTRDIPGNIRKADSNWAKFTKANRSSQSPGRFSSDSQPDRMLKKVRKNLSLIEKSEDE